MARCLEPNCGSPAISGSDFCTAHQLVGKPIIYVRKGWANDSAPESPERKDRDDSAGRNEKPSSDRK